MDIIQELITTFSEDDKREFRIFINRQKSKKQRKDLDLFELINEQIPAETIQKKLYKTPNKVAYHTLRKRLLKHLTDFIVLKQIDDDTTATSSISGLISLSSFLFKNQSDDLAWRFLLKAEKIALENENYSLLNTIYHLQLEKVDEDFSPTIDNIYSKLTNNKTLVDEDERANIAYSYIKKTLNNARIKGEEKDLEKTIQEILKKYDLENVVFSRPQLLYKVLDLTRRFMFSKKDFYSFEPYVINIYNKLTDNFGFSKNNHFYKISILYMIAHALYRNRKFKDSIIYLEQMHENMQAYNKSFYNQFSSKYIQLKAANLTYVNKNETSITLLNSIPDSNFKKMTIVDQLNTSINLCVYYFNQSMHKEANNIIQTFNHSDNWLEKKMGIEWVLKKNLIEIIIQFELGNIDIVLNRIRAFNRSYSHLYKQTVFQRVSLFIEIIKVMIDSPEELKNEDYKAKISKQLINIPEEQEDLQAMAFYCWIKSKIINQKYYDVLLDVVNQMNLYPPLI